MGKKKKEKKSGKAEKSEKKKKSPAAAQAEQKENAKNTEHKELDGGEALAMFRALSDENRLSILGLLSEKELCTAELLEKVGVVQSTMSHHMKVLCDSGLVNCRREGKKSCYSISRDGVKRLKEYICHWSDV